MTAIGPQWRKPGETWAQFLRRRRRQTRGLSEARCMVTLAELSALADRAGPGEIGDFWRRQARLLRRRYEERSHIIIPLPALERLVSLSAGDLFHTEERT